MNELKDRQKELLENCITAFTNQLGQKYDNLKFYISSYDGEVTAWVKVSYTDFEGLTKDISREGLNIPYMTIDNLNEAVLEELNDKALQVRLHPKEYFICSVCREVHRIEDLEDSVFAGWYCKECAKDPVIAKLIAQSKEKGFYD